MTKVIVLGADIAPITSEEVRQECEDLTRLIAHYNLPVFAEPESFLRLTDRTIDSASSLLPLLPEKLYPDFVIVVGHMTTSRAFSYLINSNSKISKLQKTKVYSFEPQQASWHEKERFPGAVIRSVNDLKKEVDFSDSSAYFNQLKKYDENIRKTIDNYIKTTGSSDHNFYDLPVLDALWKQVLVHIRKEPDKEYRVLLGSSNTIRNTDIVLEGVGFGAQNLHIFANRGLAGIDGLIATAQAIALGKNKNNENKEVKTIAVLGDISALHDVGGFFLGEGESEPDILFVIMNDQGGGIFSLLEHGKITQNSSARQQIFERYFSTPHKADFAALAQAYNLSYTKINRLDQLHKTLETFLSQTKSQKNKRHLVEIPIKREGNLGYHDNLVDKIQENFRDYRENL